MTRRRRMRRTLAVVAPGGVPTSLLNVINRRRTRRTRLVECPTSLLNVINRRRTTRMRLVRHAQTC